MAGRFRTTIICALLLTGAPLLGCDAVGGRGYEVVERSELALADAARSAPGPADTLLTIARAGEVGYECVRILPGAAAEWRADTMLVTQREAGGQERYYCVPFNVSARTQGVEATARVYPADPNGDEPGYDGWIVRRGPEASPSG